jgi:tartrate dehydratase beta subunit/fumarate hydratase class I family protein
MILFCYDQTFLPLPEEKTRALKVGDEVLVSGVVFTGRGIGG